MVSLAFFIDKIISATIWL